MMLTQADAREIARKLGAEIQPGRQHDQAVFRHKGKYITRFGIRRASRDVGHDYIPKQLYLKQCRDFLVCTMSVEDYVGILARKSLIDAADVGP